MNAMARIRQLRRRIMLWQPLLIFYLSSTRGGTLKLSDLFLVPQLKIYRVLCLQQDLYLSVDIKFLTAEPALDLYELLGGFLS